MLFRAVVAVMRSLSAPRTGGCLVFSAQPSAGSADSGPMGDPSYDSKQAAHPQVHAARPREPEASLPAPHAIAVPIYDFGEHLVGGGRTAQIHVPFNQRDVAAIVCCTIDGADFRLEAPAEIALPSSADWASGAAAAEQASPTIVYAPTTPGHHEGTLSWVVVWSDGMIETKTTALRGRARTLDQVPRGPVDEAALVAEPRRLAQSWDQAVQAELAVEADDRLPGEVDKEFDRAALKATKAATELAEAQAAGCDAVDRDASVYKKRVAKTGTPPWWDLAEAALTIATAAVAEEVVFAFEVEKVLGAAIKQGLKLAGKSALEAIAPSATPSPAGGQAERDPGMGYSTNPRIDFFLAQKDVLEKQKEANGTYMIDVIKNLRPLHRADPKRAKSSLEKVTAALVDCNHQAREHQATATTASWVAYVARAVNGSEQVADTTGAEQRATQMGPLLADRHAGAPRPADGVLELRLASAVAPAQIVSAALHGVSYAIVDRVRATRLSELRIPMRFVLGAYDSEPTIVTRDEAGRVHVDGDLSALASYAPDAIRDGSLDSIAGATAMIDQVLATTLREARVAIATDDETPRGTVNQ